MNKDSYTASPAVQAIFDSYLPHFTSNSGNAAPKGKQELLIFQRKMYEIQRDLITLYHRNGNGNGKWGATQEALRGRETVKQLNRYISEMKATEEKENGR